MHIRFVCFLRETRVKTEQSIKLIEVRRFFPVYYRKVNHQGKSNVLLFPTVSQGRERAGPMQCRERLGGLLKYYAREAA